MVDKKIVPPLLQVRDLTVVANHSAQQTVILNKINFDISPGKSMALIGESGSGKTMTAYALLDILPENLSRVSGEIIFKGKTVATSGKNSISELRGKNISIIFQEPVAALNPVFSVGEQLSTIIKTHSGLSRQEVRHKTLESLDEVGFTHPDKIYHSYPHQLSGGMAQRIMIAMALSSKPDLVIADEPTTALDVSTQLKILTLISELQQNYNFALLIISHDMRVVSSLTDSIVILQNGKNIYRGKIDKCLHTNKNVYIRSFFDMMPPPHNS